MAEIRKLGWAGAWLALSIFAAGFLTGAIYHHVTMPPAISAVPQHTVTEIPARLPVLAEITHLAQEVSGMRAELTEMNATLLRIEAAMAKR